MIFDNYNYCFLNHSHELITLKFVTLACVFVAPSCVVVRLGYHILVLRVNLPSFTRKSTFLPGLTHPDLAGLLVHNHGKPNITKMAQRISGGFKGRSSPV